MRPLTHPGRGLLGLALLIAGVGHLTTQRTEFQAQVPDWFPLDADFVVLASGVVEILLGLALVSGWRRVHVGWVVDDVVDASVGRSPRRDRKGG